MVTPVSTAALVISTTTPDGTAAFGDYLLTISMVIGIDGRSSGG